MSTTDTRHTHNKWITIVARKQQQQKKSDTINNKNKSSSRNGKPPRHNNNTLSITDKLKQTNSSKQQQQHNKDLIATQNQKTREVSTNNHNNKKKYYFSMDEEQNNKEKKKRRRGRGRTRGRGRNKKDLEELKAQMSDNKNNYNDFSTVVLQQQQIIIPHKQQIKKELDKKDNMSGTAADKKDRMIHNIGNQDNKKIKKPLKSNMIDKEDDEEVIRKLWATAKRSPYFEERDDSVFLISPALWHEERKHREQAQKEFEAKENFTMNFYAEQNNNAQSEQQQQPVVIIGYPVESDYEENDEVSSMTTEMDNGGDGQTEPRQPTLLSPDPDDDEENEIKVESSTTDSAHVLLGC